VDLVGDDDLVVLHIAGLQALYQLDRFCHAHVAVVVSVNEKHW
jgi:hypothetical protein